MDATLSIPTRTPGLCAAVGRTSLPWTPTLQVSVFCCGESLPRAWLTWPTNGLTPIEYFEFSAPAQVHTESDK